MQFQTSLRQIAYALSEAVDLVDSSDSRHGKRVAFLAGAVGEALGLSPAHGADLLHAALVHECGTSSRRARDGVDRYMDWQSADHHCVRGANLIGSFDPLAHLAPVLRFHHTPWHARDGLDVAAGDLLLANCLYAADLADALLVEAGVDVLVAAPRVRERIGSLSGALFAPEVAQAFLQVSASEAFWLTLAPDHLAVYHEERRAGPPDCELGVHELKQMARVFARLVDAKSRFTAEHSLGVARLAAFIGRLMGFDETRCELLEVAGLLHDIGKLRVPDELLDKPGPLSDEERALMAHHSFDSYQVLRRIPGLATVARWVGSHHETLDGSGYPFRLRGGQLDIEARVLAVADIFQALLQDRPYRRALDLDAVLDVLERMVGQRRLDARVVEAVSRELHECADAALGAPPPGRARLRREHAGADEIAAELQRRTGTGL